MRFEVNFQALVQQVFQNNPQQMRIRFRFEALFNPEFNSPFRLSFFQFFRHFAGQAAHVYVFQTHTCACDPRKIQHVVDQVSHALRGRADTLQVLLPLVIEFLGVILQQCQAESIDASATERKSCETE